MNHKKKSSVFLLGVFLFVTQILQAQNERPNILLIIADDASRTSFGAYGSNFVETPNFDRLANKGILFTNAFTSNPKCSPSRASLLTGRYSWQLEEACNHNPFLSDRWLFYPSLLEKDGYFVGFTGKGWGPGIYKNELQGGDFRVQHNPAGHAFNNKTLKPPYNGISNIDYVENFRTFLKEKADDKPFCFWMGVKEPHRGYESGSGAKEGKVLTEIIPQSFLGDNEIVRGDLSDYAVEVEWFDKQIGQSIKLLEENGFLENTLIVVTSDHGMPFPRIKGQIYDEGFHVPLVISWRAGIKKNCVISDFINFADIAPTITEAAGVPIPQSMTGKSFLDILLSKKEEQEKDSRDYTLVGKERHDLGRTDGELISVSYPVRAIRNAQFLYIRNFKTDRWPAGDPEFGFMNCDNSPTKTYILKHNSSAEDMRNFELCFGKRPEEELYDVNSDPDCIVNLAGNRQYAKIKRQLWKKLKKELTLQHDPRIMGKGEIFDFYPNRNISKAKELYGERFYDPVMRFIREYPCKKNLIPEDYY
ncbi:sulfatase family protein [Maribellus maritimus]|uniref:sulfatase family protein n=1 Tax=Maribellus maritimus TaxID=2870838 RepID=UPI001EEC71F2|nr:sulfatase [Maribellus maritimus]MCG6187641.1 sulfatase [Maribellus maritimus]